MKFDICLMNPPYTAEKTDTTQRDAMLHYKFLLHVLTISDSVISVLPATWMNTEKNRVNLPLNGRGGNIEILSETEHLFDTANLAYNIAISYFTPNKEDITVEWGTGQITEYDNIKNIKFSDRFKYLNSIINKGYKIGPPEMMNFTRTNKILATGGGSGKIKTDPIELKDKWIVRLAPMIPNRERRPNNFGIMNIDPKNPPVYKHNGIDNIPTCCLSFNTEKEARNCYKYLASDLVRSYSIAYKNNSAASAAFRYIPWPQTFNNDSSIWNNENISDIAELTIDERNWLKKMLPDCYHVRKNETD